MYAFIFVEGLMFCHWVAQDDTCKLLPHHACSDKAPERQWMCTCMLRT